MERSRQQQDARDRAVKTFQHYIRLLLERSGGKPDHDTDVEVESIVDDILAAASLPERSAHAEAVAGLQSKGHLGRLHDGENITPAAPVDPRD